MTLPREILNSLGCQDGFVDYGTAIRALEIQQEEMYETCGLISKVDINKRELLHSKIQLIKKYILNIKIDEEDYEVINNLCEEISHDICPWKKY